MTTVFYSEDYTASAYAFDTTRKATWIAESLAQDPIPGVVIEAPVPLTPTEIEVCHSAEYVESVRTGGSLATSSGFSWDPGIWTMVTATNGGAVAAAERALATGQNAGSLSSGLHHAARRHGKGFCTFNGLAIAAKRLADTGVRVLVLDLDAHCGGGTWDILHGEPLVSSIDIAVSAFDEYSPDSRDDWTLDIVRADDYLPTLLLRLSSREEEVPGVVLYNAGMDPYSGSAIGAASGMSADRLQRREELVFEWAGALSIPVAFVLAGGYTSGENPPETLVNLHRMTIAAAAGG